MHRKYDVCTLPAVRDLYVYEPNNLTADQKRTSFYIKNPDHRLKRFVNDIALKMSNQYRKYDCSHWSNVPRALPPGGFRYLKCKVAKDGGEYPGLLRKNESYQYRIHLLKAADNGKPISERDRYEYKPKAARIFFIRDGESFFDERRILTHLCHNEECLNWKHILLEDFNTQRGRMGCGGGPHCHHAPRCLVPGPLSNLGRRGVPLPDDEEFWELELTDQFLLNSNSHEVLDPTDSDSSQFPASSRDLACGRKRGSSSAVTPPHSEKKTRIQVEEQDELFGLPIPIYGKICEEPEDETLIFDDHPDPSRVGMSFEAFVGVVVE